MLQTVLRQVGRALRPIRPGLGKLAGSSARAGVPLVVRSASFSGVMPPRLSVDGDGLSPALSWTGLPGSTRTVVLLVQDADVPAPRPFTQLVLYGPATLDHLSEGEVPSRIRGASPQGWRCGRNGVGLTGWLAPAPLRGHGAHRYAFQVFALDFAPRFAVTPGRGAMVRAMAGHIVGFGQVIGTYERR